MQINTENILNKMKKYLEIPSPGGFTKEATLEVKKILKCMDLRQS